jgi:hypothetical protein
MESMKILRERIGEVNCYTMNENGKADVKPSAYYAYLEALECVANFEAYVDKQYEAKK